MLGWLQSAAASNSSSAAVLQLRRGLRVAPGQETEGKRGRVSEGFMEKGVRPERREGEGQHGLAVVVVYLGTASSMRTTGGRGFAATAPPSWRCTRGGGVRGRDSGEVWRNGEARAGYLYRRSGARWTWRWGGPGEARARHRGGGGAATVSGRRGARMVAWRRAVRARRGGRPWESLGGARRALVTATLRRGRVPAGCGAAGEGAAR